MNNIPDYIYNKIKEKDTNFVVTVNNYYNYLNIVNDLEKKLILKKKILNNLKDNFQNQCKHNWDMDDPQYQTPTSWTCSICGAYK